MWPCCSLSKHLTSAYPDLVIILFDDHQKSEFVIRHQSLFFIDVNFFCVTLEGKRHPSISCLYGGLAPGREQLMAAARFAYARQSVRADADRPRNASRFAKRPCCDKYARVAARNVSPTPTVSATLTGTVGVEATTPQAV